MVRDGQWQQEFLSCPLPERLAIAQDLRRKSMESNKNKQQQLMDVSQQEVERLMLEHNVQRLIHGHTHKPAIHDFTINNQPAQRIVLGDWDQNGWALKVSHNDYNLYNFEL